MNDKQKIMIVDDEPINIDTLYRLLKTDYMVIAATSGETALSMLDKGPLPDLVLLDVRMPEMDGYEVCRRMKADARTRELPVIFVTAADHDEDQLNGFAQGAVDYITKPVRKEIVLARVRTHTALRKKQRQLEAKTAALEEALRVFENKITVASHISRMETETPQKDQGIQTGDILSQDDMQELIALENDASANIGLMCRAAAFSQNELDAVKKGLGRYGEIIAAYPACSLLGATMSELADALHPAKESAQLLLATMEVMLFTLTRWREHLGKDELRNVRAYEDSLMADFKTIWLLLDKNAGTATNAR